MIKREKTLPPTMKHAIWLSMEAVQVNQMKKPSRSRINNLNAKQCFARVPIFLSANPFQMMKLKGQEPKLREKNSSLLVNQAAQNT